jgi:hypothetical protein
MTKLLLPDPVDRPDLGGDANRVAANAAPGSAPSENAGHPARSGCSRVCVLDHSSLWKLIRSVIAGKMSFSRNSKRSYRRHEVEDCDPRHCVPEEMDAI